VKQSFLFLLFFISAISSFGQDIEETYPKTYWCPNDSFAIKFKNYPDLTFFEVSRKDNGSPGTDASPGDYVTIYYGSDSLVLNYHNKIPYAQITYINFASPKGKTTLRFHFNDVTSYFSKDYMERNEGKVQYDIPEVYELANIIWTLSPSGQRATDLNKQGDYYRKVVSYFRPYLNDPVFEALDFPDTLYESKYYDFRENSFAFNFQDTEKGAENCKLLFNGPYYYVMGKDLSDSSLFGKLIPLIEDFAVKSKFRIFYKNNIGFFEREIEREKDLLPVKQMWKWLEVQFTNTDYQSYKVISSPLIGGSHSTQNYFTPRHPGWFGECVMFIATTERVDTLNNLSEIQKQALMSGVVFTEIDHNYVNPVSGKYAIAIDSIFSNRKIWAKQGNGSNWYGSPESVFNEYMTWAVFCLYMLDNYDKPTADLAINERETRMVEKRNFIRFKEFDQALIKIREEHKDLKVADLYPFILEWCRSELK
jgi:hypothetical protein